MKDSEFKKLEHQIGNLRIASCGSEVATGYKPDITVVDESGKLVLILESEQKRDRKAFIGNIVKAEKYAEEMGAYPGLVIVMQEFGNTTVRQITNHLQPYVDWLSRMKENGLNVQQIFVISDREYIASVQNGELIGSGEFLKRSAVVGVHSPNKSMQSTR